MRKEKLYKRNYVNKMKKIKEYNKNYQKKENKKWS